MKPVKKHGVGQSTRRKFALERLETQLKRGSKRMKTEDTLVPLTPKDKGRMEREIETLKTRMT